MGRLDKVRTRTSNAEAVALQASSLFAGYAGPVIARASQPVANWGAQLQPTPQLAGSRFCLTRTEKVRMSIEPYRLPDTSYRPLSTNSIADVGDQVPAASSPGRHAPSDSPTLLTQR